MARIIDNTVGPAFTANDDAQKVVLGRIVELSDGGQAMYVKSSLSACSTFAAVLIQKDYTVQMLTTTNAALAVNGGKQVGFAQTSLATGNFGWVQISGRPKCNLLVSCAPYVPLYTTATIGQLDDATISTAGAGCVIGVMSGTTISTATAVSCIVSRGGAWVQVLAGG